MNADTDPVKIAYALADQVRDLQDRNKRLSESASVGCYRALRDGHEKTCAALRDSRSEVDRLNKYVAEILSQKKQLGLTLECYRLQEQSSAKSHDEFNRLVRDHAKCPAGEHLLLHLSGMVAEIAVLKERLAKYEGGAS